MSLGLLPNKAHSLSIDNDIAIVAGLKKKENMYSNGDVTTSNFEWNDNLCANPYTSL